MTTNIPPTITATLTKNQMMINITGPHGIKISIQSSMIDWMSLKHFKLLSLTSSYFISILLAKSFLDLSILKLLGTLILFSISQQR